ICRYALSLLHIFTPDTLLFFYSLMHITPTSTLFPYTTLFRSDNLPKKSLYFSNNSEIHLIHKLLGTILSVSDLTKTYKSGQSTRSEEHTSELQSRENLVCRLLLEKKENIMRY